MNIQQFQYVLAVVDLRNFEAAAERCFVTQSTLSTMISRLEDEMDVKIFNRKTKPVSITPEGEQIIERLRIILNEIDLLKNMIHELKGEMVGEFKIGIIPTIAPYLLPLFLDEFSKLFPKVNMTIKEMTTAQIQQSLKIRSIDIGILALPINDKDLVETRLYDEPFLLYNCTDIKSKSKVTIDNLDYSKICLLQEGHCLRTQVSQICEQSDKYSTSDVNYVIESGSMDSLIRITNTRKGITILPYLAAIDLPHKEQEKITEFKDPVPVREVGLITHRFFVKKKLLEGLQDVIQSSVKGLLPETNSLTVLDPL